MSEELNEITLILLGHSNYRKRTGDKSAANDALRNEIAFESEHSRTYGVLGGIGIIRRFDARNLARRP